MLRGHSLRRTVAVLLLLPLPTAVTAPAQVRTAPAVREIADTAIRDVALMRVEDGVPVIRYNPRLLARLGSDLTRFFLAHERGHAARGHAEGGALAATVFTGPASRVRQELEADCYAAAQLGSVGDTAAVHSAIDFFVQLGPRRHDRLHPTGSQRAAQILGCLPDVMTPRAP